MAIVLYHDGCALCQSIAASLGAVPGLRIDIVDLGADKRRAAEAQAAGVTRLPSLVVGGQVLRLEDHSSLEHVL